MRPSRFRAALPCLLLLLSCVPARAQVPACTPARAGMRTCLAQEDCECRYERGGALLDQPAGWRWSCSLLRTCEATTPAAPPPRGLPDGFSYAPGAAGTAEDGQASQYQPRYQGRGPGKPPPSYGAPYR